MDGTGVPMRNSELVGRAGKQPDGSSKTREVKLVTVWSAEGRDKDSTPVRDEGSISYSAAIESAASRDTDIVGAHGAAGSTRLRSSCAISRPRASALRSTCLASTLTPARSCINSLLFGEADHRRRFAHHAGERR
jgi:hypothetical protein